VRILVVHRYYYPDQVPCASIMRTIASRLHQDGHQVDILTGKPSRTIDHSRDKDANPDGCDGLRVFRLNLQPEVSRPVWRIINALYLGLSLLVKAIFTRYDVIISTSIPPVLGGFFASLAARLTRTRFIYYCMDLHPEVGRVSGDFSNPVLYRLLLRIDDWSCRQARPVLVHSEDMRNTLRARSRGNEYEIELMNNFALPTQHITESKTEWHHSSNNNRLTLIYAGNMGRFQGLETLIGAMGLVPHRKDIELIMMGEGVAKADLISLQKQTNSNVRFYDYQPVEVAKAAINTADIGLVMLSPNIYKYAYPSKTMAYLEQGCPIIAVVEEESELARTMKSDGYGFSVPIGNTEALAQLLMQLADDMSWKGPMSQSALTAFERYFSASVVLDNWTKLVDQSHRTS